MSAGEDFTVIAADDAVFVFGKNDKLQLGLEQAVSLQSSPKALFGSHGQIRQIASGWGHSLVLTCTTQCYCLPILLAQGLFSWGSNLHGQCGRNLKSEFLQVGKVEVETELKEIACGSCHSMLLTSSGDVLLFGSAKDGKIPSQTDVTQPLRINLPKKAMQIASGSGILS